MRRRPSIHIKKVWTKRGRKKVLVNKHIPKRASINQNDRKIFSHLSDPKFYNKEFGGGIDFNKKGKLEQIHVQKGLKYSIDLPQDYEVLYHTHPSNYIDPPSPEDIIALLKSRNQQAELVFRKGQAFIVSKTPKTEALSRLPATSLHKKLDRAFSPFKFKKNEEGLVKDHLQQLGFNVSLNKNKETNINLKIKPVE